MGLLFTHDVQSARENQFLEVGRTGVFGVHVHPAPPPPRPPGPLLAVCQPPQIEVSQGFRCLLKKKVSKVSRIAIENYSAD